MKKMTLLALLGLSALAAACHEQRQDNPNYDAVRQHSNDEHRDLQQQKAPDSDQSR